jgi:hypothetical protein
VPDEWAGWQREAGGGRWIEVIRGHSRAWVEAWLLRHATGQDFQALPAGEGLPRPILLKAREPRKQRKQMESPKKPKQSRRRGARCSEVSIMGVARQLGVGSWIVRHLVRSGKVSPAKVGMDWEFSEQDVEQVRRILEQRKVRQ